MLWPLASGRSLPIFVFARFTPAVGFTGNPARQVVLPPTCHPPATASRKPFWIFIFFPLPKGRSYNPDITSRWRLSKADSPRSQSMHLPSCENRVSLYDVRIPLVVSMDFDQV